MLGAAEELIRGAPGEHGRCNPPIQGSSPGRCAAWLGPQPQPFICTHHTGVFSARRGSNLLGQQPPRGCITSSPAPVCLHKRLSNEPANCLKRLLTSATGRYPSVPGRRRRVMGAGRGQVEVELSEPICQAFTHCLVGAN
ncbi:unnamed protein product [Pleuronectes platessa]|uniref:Uncharacterized protein n=1 Tax=Pleuronectes platessa TaxID=8262 RepID=A0A9N7V819_PLEPL|nr:unnamed protein product [Pleuronectes platessa]